MNPERDPGASLGAILRRFDPDVAGISALTATLRSAWQAAEQVKRTSGRIRVVMGGVHPTLDPRQTLENTSVDYAVLGEGEETFVELVRHIADPERLRHVPGIAFRDRGGIWVTAKRPHLATLDRLPMPAYDLFDPGRYFSPQCSSRRIAAMVTSRGCPFHCIFCDAHTVHGRRYRCHSPERVVREMLHLKHLYGVREVIFKDSEFTLDRGRTERICDSLRRCGTPVRWSCNARVGSIDAALLGKMKAAGCRLIQFGVESGNQSVLDRLGKGITVGQIEETFLNARRAGIRTVANCMVGNPGETLENVLETLSLVQAIRADYLNVSFVTPYPGTEIHRMAVENGWLLEGHSPLDLRQDRCAMNATAMATPELQTAMVRLQQAYYLRPWYVLRRALTLNPVEWRKNFNGARELLAPLRPRANTAGAGGRPEAGSGARADA